jgi:hypothetical protein
VWDTSINGSVLPPPPPPPPYTPIITSDATENLLETQYQPTASKTKTNGCKEGERKLT